MKNVMIDIETLGTGPNSVILSVAAVEFCAVTGAIGRKFYKKIDLLSSLAKGFVVEKETLMWWTAQKADQFKELFTNEEPITNVMQQLLYWFADNDKLVWANSPAFDLVILENAFKKCGFSAPWQFYNERCVRTLVSLYPDAKTAIPKPENAHNALADCEYQILYCVNALNQLTISK